MDGLNFQIYLVKHEIDEVNLDINFSKKGKFNFHSVGAELVLLWWSSRPLVLHKYTMLKIVAGDQIGIYE